MVLAFGLWDAELPFCEELLAQDARNNSAWSQRAFLAQHALAAALGDRRDDRVQALLLREACFAAAGARDVPHNESAWNYLLGLAHVLRDAAGQGGDAAAVTAGMRTLHAAVYEAALGVLATSPDCVPARSALMQQYVRSACDARAAGDATIAAKADAAAVTLCEGLVVADPLRAGWYESMRKASIARCA